MKDKVLAELVKAAEEGDGVALVMLADLIADADPEDRMECLEAWCGAMKRAKEAERLAAYERDRPRISYPPPPVTQHTFDLRGGETWRSMADLPFRDDGGQYAADAVRHLRRRAGDVLAKAMDDDRWYAVRFSTRRPPQRHPLEPRTIEVELRVVPMDGGTVRLPGDGRAAG